MKKKIILPSLFVLNTFLVGITPKISKAGSEISAHNLNQDSVSYVWDADFSNQLPQSCTPEFAKSFMENKDSLEQQNETKDTVSYTISWHGGSWVKYTSEDGSGFIRTGGSRTWRNMNPGALRYGDFSRQCGACGAAGGFAVFPSEELGMDALRNLLLSDRYANLTIAAAIRKYAPSSDNNNPKLYQQRLARLTGVNLNKKIKHLTEEELDNVAFAIKKIEGWKTGKNESFDGRDMVAKNVLDYKNFLKYRTLKQKQYSA